MDKILELTEYQDHEFCKAVNCDMYDEDDSKHCMYGTLCNFSAKEFHKWLNANGYKIVKDTKDSEIQIQLEK